MQEESTIVAHYLINVRNEGALRVVVIVHIEQAVALTGCFM